MKVIPIVTVGVFLVISSKKSILMSLISKFEQFYRSVSTHTIEQLDDLYAQDAVLVDPISEHHGLTNIKNYFHSLLANTSKCNCLIEHISATNDDIFLTWKMTIAHPKLNGGSEFVVNGISRLIIDNQKVVYHRDYYDLGEMIYEQVPLLKQVIRTIKRRLG